MIDDLFRFYKDQLTFYSLAIKPAAGWKKAIILFSACLYIFGAFYHTFSDVNLTSIIFGILGLLALFLGPILAIYFIDEQIKNNSDLDPYLPKNQSWTNQNLYKFKINEVKAYLNNNRLDQHEQLLIIKESLDRMASRQKAPLIFQASVFLSIFLVIFSQFAGKVFEKFHSNLNSLLYALIILLIVPAFITFLLPALRQLRDLIFLRKYMWLNELTDLIEEVRTEKVRKRDTQKI